MRTRFHSTTAVNRAGMSSTCIYYTNKKKSTISTQVAIRAIITSFFSVSLAVLHFQER
jgi:hypothetical protein